VNRSFLRQSQKGSVFKKKNHVIEKWIQAMSYLVWKINRKIPVRRNGGTVRQWYNIATLLSKGFLISDTSENSCLLLFIFFSFWEGSLTCYVARTGIKFTILLPQPLECCAQSLRSHQSHGSLWVRFQLERLKLICPWNSFLYLSLSLSQMCTSQCHTVRKNTINKLFIHPALSSKSHMGRILIYHF
jgi:hypothetical protein